MFPRAVKVYVTEKNLAAIASLKDGDCQNCYFLIRPDLQNPRIIMVKKIKGYAQQGTNAGVTNRRGLAIGGYQPSTGTAGLYATWNTDIYLVGAGAPTAQGRALTADLDGEFEQINDVLYYTNGSDAVQTLTAGVWANSAAGEPLSGANTVAKFLSWHNFMNFAARTSNAPNKLNISDAGAPNTFSGNTKTFPYKIIGMKPLGEYEMVYTEKSIHAVSGYSPSQLTFRELIQPHPCVSHRSITLVPKDNGVMEHYYLGADYPWATDGSNFRILGKKSWDSIFSNLSVAQLTKASAIFDPLVRQWLLSIPTGAATANDTVYAYDILSNLWIKRPYWAGAAFASFGVPNPDIYMLEASAVGKVFKINSGNDIVMPTTTLNGALSATATTVTVGSTTGFSSSGVIIVDSESMSYSGTTATTFTGVVRGYSGTTAASHSNGANVYVAHKFRYSTINDDSNQPNLYKKFETGWVNTKVATSAYSLDVGVDIDQYGPRTVKSMPIKSVGTTWSSFTWGNANWGAPSILATPTNRYFPAGKGKTIKHVFEENANIQQDELYEFQYRFRRIKNK